MSLASDIETYVATVTGPLGHEAMIRRCLAIGGAQGLAGLRRLAESNYGGITFKYELQTPAATALVLFGGDGLRELTGLALENLESRNATHALELLASIASGPTVAPFSFVQSASLEQEIKNYLVGKEDLKSVAMDHLCQIVLAYESDDEVAFRVGHAMANLTTSTTPAPRALFDALAARWLAVSTPILDEYEELILNRANDEPSFQAFLTAHPHLLDPFAVDVWPEPDLFGFKSPDFIVRRADNTYIVVEIECPGKSLITKASPQPTNAVTHAITQVTEYDGYLLQKYSDLVAHFPGWSAPELLVVCGLERELDAKRMAVLSNFNRKAGAKVVGFDWLADRARIVARNILRGDVIVHRDERLV